MGTLTHNELFKEYQNHGIYDQEQP